MALPWLGQLSAHLLQPVSLWYNGFVRVDQIRIWQPRLRSTSVTSGSRAGEQQTISRQAIRTVAEKIAAAFEPERIILFGSHAHGQPGPDSDVDLLVVMETSLRSREQRLEISRALSPRPFPLDIIVRSPKELEERISLGDFFLQEIVTQGKVVYDRSGA
jgi:predicted nucleotidyltransferase